MRLVVTGASGNLGTALLRRLRADGGHDVAGIARRPPPPEPPYDDVEWHALDLSNPAAEGLRDVVTGADAVVHLAWGFQPTRDEAYLERLGVRGTRAVLGAAADAGVPHLVHMSSVGAYSPAPGVRVSETWPVAGTPSSPYSRHKVAAERILDAHVRSGAAPVVTRLRPGFVVQHDAGSGLLRYGLPPWVPSAVVGLLPVLPLDRDLTIPVVHADDVADAVVRALDRVPGGAFNLAAEPPLTQPLIAAALGARPVHVPSALLGGLVRASWLARLQPLDSSWIDLAFSVPLLDTSRARTDLGWAPEHDSVAALSETVVGMGRSAGTASAVLRPRHVLAELAETRRGPVSRRETA